jgi:NAD(P)-dependent dehydrogenase (short-subunit alcohol dehydrogenase family)
MAGTGKVAIVTGSATGLGATCALDLAARGWNVCINYTKSKKEADETYEGVKAKGAEAILVQADVGQDGECRKLVNETLKKWGRVDGLINNAGTTKFQNQGDLDGVTPEDFDRILRVNVTGPYMMSRAVFPAMKKQYEDKGDRSAIVNISSIAGVMGVGSSIQLSFLWPVTVNSRRRTRWVVAETVNGSVEGWPRTQLKPSALDIKPDKGNRVGQAALTSPSLA